MDCRHAEPQRRLGRIRCGQPVLLSQQHPVRRSRGVARSSDRGRDGALHLDAGAARRNCAEQRCGAARARLFARDPDAGRQLVRPLGHELHLRHLVRPVRAQCRRGRTRRERVSQGGGWGEDGSSYKLDYQGYEKAPSTPSQTAWALLGLMAAGEVDHPAVTRGVDYVSRAQGEDGFWNEPRYTATGFPRVFYLRYHGYSKFFPLCALARYRNLKATNSRSVAFGM